MTIKRHLIHVKSNVPNKIPSSEDIRYGEIAINYTEGNEKIYIKSANDTIQSIQTDSQNSAMYLSKQGLSGETQARINNDNILSGKIDTEITARSLADSYISSVTDSNASKITSLSATTAAQQVQINSLQTSAGTISNSLTDYMPKSGGTFTGQIGINTTGSPLNVTNTTVNNNFNADMLDGIHANGMFTDFSNIPSTSSVSLTIGGTNKEIQVSYSTSAGTATNALKTAGKLTVTGASNTVFNGSSDTTIIIPSNNVTNGTTGNVITSLSSDNSGITYNKSNLQVETATTSVGYAKSYKLTLGGAQIGETINIPQDQFLSSVTYNESTKILTFNMILSSGQIQATNINLTNLIDVYDSNNGIQKTTGSTGSTFSVKIKDTNNEFLGVDSNGVYVTGVTTAINSAINTTNSLIAAETSARQSSDSALHQEIQAITSVTHASSADYATNSSTATKLQTARSIWGQSFDGTNHITGNLELGSSIINQFNDGGGNGELIKITRSDTTLPRSLATEGYGIGFKENTNFTLLAYGGKVAIASNSYATYSLDVNGNGRFISDLLLDATIGTRDYTTHTTGWRIDHTGTGDLRGLYINNLWVNNNVKIGDLSAITYCSGIGIYSNNTFLSTYSLIGDLTKTNNYMEYANGILNYHGNVYVSGGNAATTDYVNTTINNLQIGGTNLISNSNFYAGISGITLTNATFTQNDTSLPDYATHGAKFTVTVANGGFYYATNSGFIPPILDDKQRYTFTFWAKTDTNVNLVAGFPSITNATSTFALTTAWTRYEIDILATGVASNLVFSLQNTGNFYITDIKLETGTKYTAWRSSLKDLNDISAANAASAAATAYNNSISYTNTHLTSYLPLSGGTLTGALSTNSSVSLANNIGLNLKDQNNVSQRTLFISNSDTVYFGCNDTPKYTILEGSQLQFNIYNSGWQTAMMLDNNKSLRVNGSVGIDMLDLLYKLSVSGDTYINGGLTVEAPSHFNDSLNVSDNVTALAFYESSDKTLKENINDIDKEDITKVNNVSLKEYNFKSDDDKTKHYGVIAQEVQSAGLDNLVKEDKNGKLSVDYISLLILKIAELEKRIAELESK